MALTGTLADLGIIDLIQFPYASQRTGELVIKSPTQDAYVYYRNGDLVHAALGSRTGIDALADLVDWTEAEFHFHLDRTSEISSIEMDLHRAVMVALKTRDERQRDASRQKQAGEGAPDRPEAALVAALSKFVEANGPIAHACVFGRGGDVLGQSSIENETSQEIESLRNTLAGLVDAYPRPQLRRTMIEDDQGMVVVARLGRDLVLLVLADKSIPLGAISRSVNKLVEEVTDLLGIEAVEAEGAAGA